MTRWPLDKHKQPDCGGDVVISNIESFGLAMDDEGCLYVSDYEKHEVRRYGECDGREGVIVAGGQGEGNSLGQLSGPNGIFVDQKSSIYVVDQENNRVMR